MLKISKWVLLLLFFSGMTACGQIDSDSPVVLPTPAPNSVASLQLVSDKTSVNTDGTDSALITVRALDSSNAAIEGEVITLATDAGALSASSATTDVTGSATVSFDAGLVSANQTAIITASAGTVVDTINISIIGSTLSLSSDKLSVGLNGGAPATLTGLVQDGSGNPVVGTALTMTSQNGLGTLTDPVGGTSGTSLNLITDVTGRVQATYAAGAVAGTDTLVLSGAEGTDSVAINVSGAQFDLTNNAIGDVSLGNSVDFTLTWNDASGVPQSNTNVTFDSGNGLFSNGATSITVQTDATGVATVTLTPDIPGVAQVNATATVGTDLFSVSDTVTVVSDIPAFIDLQVSPSVVGTDDGTGNPPSAVLTATVRDANNLAVANQKVVFAVESGPGGGERITPITATTNTAGIATTTFFSGGLTSAQNGVTVSATVAGLTPATASLTIGQQAARIVFGTTNNVSTVTSNGLEIGYAMPITVQVTDNNGNPIANQPVSLGIYPLLFKTGGFADHADFTSIFISNSYDNEDANRNGILDAGEDGSTGYPANGNLDPGNVVSIPASVTTDANGFGAFNITYAKSYGVWIDVELSATTVVSGNVAKTTHIETLVVKDGDTPYIGSPFGI